MKNKQKNQDLIKYVSLNAKTLIKRLVELTEYQENVSANYSIKKIKDC